MDRSRDEPGRPADRGADPETIPDFEKDAVAPASELDELAETTPTDILRGDLEARPEGVLQPDAPVERSLELLESTDLRSGETDDPDVATEEGLAWVPPTDPPVVGTEGWDPRIAAGFGTTATDEPYDADHHRSPLTAEDEMVARVREAILADAATSTYADRLSIDAEGGVVTLSGQLDGPEDEDELVAAASIVDGVAQVRSRLSVEGL